MPQTDPSTSAAPTAAPPQPQLVFSDMENEKWAIESVEYLYAQGIVSGVDAEHFEPERLVTREEFTKMAMQMAGAQPTGQTLPFTDVLPSDWSYPYIQAAYSADVVQGVRGDFFDKASPMTREQAAVILDRVITRFEAQRPDPGLNIYITFDDIDDASDWAVDSINYLLRIGMIKGRAESMFMPQEYITRAEAAAMLYAYLNTLGKVDA